MNVSIYAQYILLKPILAYSSQSQPISAISGPFHNILSYSCQFQNIPDFFSLFLHICLDDMMLILGSVRLLAPDVSPADILGIKSCRILGRPWTQIWGSSRIKCSFCRHFRITFIIVILNYQ